MTRLTAGIIADGVFKVVLGAAYIARAAPLGRLLGVSGLLMVGSGAALLIGGGIEIGYARSRPVRTCLRLVGAYDSGWGLAPPRGRPDLRYPPQLATALPNWPH
ncbi:hypothetical protein ACIBO9_23645 [Streptomyces prunicolor]|uniref:hypothetical protein n=1 Tax=Streptomyces prunicolor TaxID=67348 RepID=UPI0037D701B6